MAENPPKAKQAQVEVEQLRFRLQELEEIFTAILNQTGEAVVVCDAAGRIIRATPWTHELCGCNPVGARFDNLLALTLAGGKPFYATGALQGESHREVAVTCEARGKGRLHLLVSAIPLGRDRGRITGCVITLAKAPPPSGDAWLELQGRFQAQTEEMQAQAEELRAANEELAVQAEELQAQNEELLVQKEELLRLSHDLAVERARLEAVLEHMPAGVIIADALTGKMLLANRRMEEILRHPVQPRDTEESYTPYHNFLANGTFRDPLECPLGRSLREGAAVLDQEIEILRGDGSRGVLLVSATPVRDPEGRVIAGVGIFNDITRRQEAEQEILRQASFPQLNPNPVLEVDFSGRITFHNAATLAVLERSGARGGIASFLPLDMPAILQEAQETGQDHFQRQVEVGDSVFSATISFPPGLKVARLYAWDLTERMRAEEALRESEKRERERAAELQAVLDAVPGIIWQAHDPECRLITGNPAAYQLLRLPPGSNLSKSAPEDERPANYRVIKDGLEIPPSEMPVQKAAAGETVCNDEIALVFEDGTTRHVLGNAVPLRDEAGQIRGSVAAFIDVTERKDAEKALRRAKEEWESTFDAVPDLIVILDNNHRIVRANRAMAEALGANPAELEGRHCYQIMHGSSSPASLCPHSLLLADGQEHAGEVHELGRDFLVSASPLTDDRGSIIGSVHVARDITALKEAEARIARQNAILTGINRVFRETLTCETEEELGQTCLAVAEELSQSRFGFIGELNQDGLLDDIAISDPGWAACRVPNSKGLVLPKGLHVHGIYGKCLREGRSEIANDPPAHPDSIGTPPGHPAITAFLGVPLKHAGQTIGMMGLGNKAGGYTDAEREAVEALAPAVVEAFIRKRAEEALRRERDFVAALLQTLGALVVVLDREGRIVRFNQACEETTGYTFQEVQGKTFFDLFLVPEEAAGVKAVFQRLTAGDVPRFYENHWVTRDGARRLISWSNTALTDEQERVLYIIGTGIDITERRQAEEALQRAHDELEQRVRERTAELQFTVTQLQEEVTERLRAEEALAKHAALVQDLYNNAPCGYHSLDQEGTFVQINDTELAWLGYSRDEVSGRMKFSDLLTAEGLKTFQETFPVFKERGWVRDLEFDLVRKDGTVMPVLLNASVIRDEAGRYLMSRSTIVDLTARKAAQAALKAERQRFYDVLEMLPAYIVLLTPDYHVPFANRYFVQRFGEDQGLHCFEYLFGRTEPCEICETYTALKTNAPHRWEWTGPDGRYYDIYDYPFTDSDGSPLIMEMGIDITERKLAEENLKRQSALLGGINRIFREALTCETEEELGRTCLAVAQEFTGSKFGFIHELNAAGSLEALAFSDPDWETCRLLPERNLRALKNIKPVGLLARSVREGESLLTNDPAGPESVGLPEGHPPLTAYLGVPLKHGGKTIGLIGLGNQEGGYAPGDQEAIETLSVAIVEALMRFRAEKRAESIGRLYRVLSKVNEAIVRAQDQETLFQQACRIAVEEGRFRMAWVGLTDPAHRAVKAVAQYGFEEGYLETLLIPLEDVPESRGPTGIAVREGRFDICNYFASEPRMAPWREQALARGYRSSAAFPLLVESQVVGALTLYAETPGFFNQEEIALLESLAADLSFALESMNREVRRRQAEEEVKKLNEELELRVRERTAQLQAANQELEAFSYSVSHDLKTPLRAIQGFSRMLAEEHTSQLDPEGLRLLRVVQDNSMLMGRLIDDLLALSRLGRQELKMRGVDLSGLAEKIFQELKAQNPHRTLNLTLKELPQAHGDWGLLRQVLVNLLQNAVTFTQPKKRAQIEVGGWTEGKEAIYYIRDNGVGFNMKYAGKLFGVFQTLHSRRDFEGTGVGLAIVQRIIHRHGGRVWAKGKVNEGATFYFSLPNVPH